MDNGQVELVGMTDNPLARVYSAARTCYSESNTGEILKGTYIKDNMYDTREEYEEALKKQAIKMENLVRKVFKSGHLSVSRHVNMTFSLNGFSRAIINQLERHGVGVDFSQQSTRYVTFDFNNISAGNVEEHYVMLEFKNLEQELLYRNSCLRSLNDYKKLIDSGMLAEDARNILGLGFRTNVLATFNIQALINFCSLRRCTNAQADIRFMADEMAKLVVGKEPWLKPYLVAKCETLGYCNEMRPCGLHKTYEELVGE